ncbi:hypothetical protein [Streptomyces chartreusis]|uniref:hypothetical protein n=1 Tax=Streptomyces chartreusis TaxID=1969 RepID=UPI002F907412
MHIFSVAQHRKAPDRPTISGWKWAICPNQSCGWQGDRDAGAWRRIAARGLTHQARTVIDRTSGQMVIRSVVDNLETKSVIRSSFVDTPGFSRGRKRSSCGCGAGKGDSPAGRIAVHQKCR